MGLGEGNRPNPTHLMSIKDCAPPPPKINVYYADELVRLITANFALLLLVIGEKPFSSARCFMLRFIEMQNFLSFHFTKAFMG